MGQPTIKCQSCSRRVNRVYPVKMHGLIMQLCLDCYRAYKANRGGSKMRHENNMKCESCKQKVTKKSETRTIVYFECPCGKRKYSRSKGL